MRYFLELAYNGTDFGGWQKQDEVISVQAVLENKLSIILRNPIEIYGCGRTDTCVHASYFTAHFDNEAEVPSNLVYRLNGMLPKSIAVFSCRQVTDELHARFSAVARTYKYFITHVRNPFNLEMACFMLFKPNVEQMNEAAKLLLSHTEYRCFCKGKTPGDSYKCVVSKACWEETQDGLIFTVTANRFLRSMVRSMVGTMLKVGLGKMHLDQFKELLDSGNRNMVGKSAPPQGLYLVDVLYPDFEKSENLIPPPIV
ncbi:MAG: tRNA pseudouridine(38-40) synthase TruA [Sphingomonadales bacterium]|nr:tRNA pseudouridine(38-40) synthase TruA [Sphingomonadales bacterium]